MARRLQTVDTGYSGIKWHQIRHPENRALARLCGENHVLKELGLLSLEPVQVDGVPVVPKHLVDAVLYPKVKLDEGERDITCFRVELVGEKEGHHTAAKQRWWTSTMKRPASPQWPEQLPTRALFWLA